MPSSFTAVLKATDVTDPESLARYCHQTIGTPYPSIKDMTVLKKKSREFVLANPNAGFQALAHTVDWCKAKKRRIVNAWFICDQAKWAWADGAVPEMDPTPVVDPNVERAINEILDVEVELRWRRMLIGATGAQNRRNALRYWTAAHQSVRT